MLWGGGAEYPSKDAIAKAEWDLLAFAVWLYKAEYASATCISYVYAVKKWHQKLTGMPALALGIVFCRLPMLFRTLKKRRPGKQREKRPWEHREMVAVHNGWTDSQGYCFPETAEGFRLYVAYVIMRVAYELLMRLSEIVVTKPPSVSVRDPLKWSDVVFEDADGNELTWDLDGAPMGEPARVRIREPPSKTRQGGGWLRLPFPSGGTTRAPIAAAPALWRYMQDYPVPRNQAAQVPLFPSQVWKGNRRPVSQITQQAFMAAFRQLCRGALPEVRYTGLGLHCFRVGGANRMIDLGASAPQVCAAGRWAGDCWILYARRHRAVLEELAVRMSAG